VKSRGEVNLNPLYAHRFVAIADMLSLVVSARGWAQSVGDRSRVL